MKTLVKEWLKAAFHVSVADGGLSLGWATVVAVVLVAAFVL
jgi:hypothetical protein